MALPFFIKQSVLTDMDGMILRIARFRTQLSTTTQSETTNSLLEVLTLYEKTLVDVRNTYHSLANGGMEYTRKYASSSAVAPVTGVNNATTFITNHNKPSDNTDLPQPSSEDTVKTYQLNYTIQKGDTLSDISKKSGVSIQELCRINNIKNPNLIIAGANMIIPVTMPSVIGNAMRLNSIGSTGGSNVSKSDTSSQTSHPTSANSKATDGVHSAVQNGTVNQSKDANTQNSSSSFSTTSKGNKTIYQYDVKTQKQTDKQFKDISFEKIYKNGKEKKEHRTIGGSGCGPSSFSTCVNALKGTEISNPQKMCKYAQECHARSAEADGTVMEDLVSSWCRDHSEFSYETIFGYGAKRNLQKNAAVDELIKSLSEGKVAVVGTTPVNGVGFFSSDSHIVAVTGVEISDNGAARFIVSDPNMDVHGWGNYKNAEIIGDKVYVDADVAKKYFTSIRLISISN